jgi:hypothetical protein
VVRPRSCRVIYYFDTPALGRRHQSFGRVILPEENYHQQQIHVEEDKNLSHPQTRKLLSLLDMASSAFANKGNWCLLI